MAEDPVQKIRATREHVIIKNRKTQLKLNDMAVSGGEDYISKRLSRLPYESDVSWGGSKLMQNRIGSDLTLVNTEGRKDRAYLINRAARICNKINQYVFSENIQRDNIDDEFKADTTRAGDSVNQFMEEVSTQTTAMRWCWVQIDRKGLLPRDVTKQQSLLDKERNKDRVYWTLWKPFEVTDWSFDSSGELLWLITEQTVYDNQDYNAEAQEQRVRTIWARGGGVRIYFDPKEKDKVLREEAFAFAVKRVPFVLIGKTSCDPYWFDDVERVQASLLNLESVNNENLFQAVYPQLILPSGIIEIIKQAAQCSGEHALELVRGLNYPILEPEDANGQTRYICPPTADLEALRKEIDMRKKDLFEIVGLALRNTERKQAESGEAKAWDHLDAECLLAEKANQLEDAEKKCVALSKEFDSTFAEYEPIYPKEFDVGDIEEDIAAIVSVGNLSLPEEGQKEVQRAGIEVLDKLIGIPEDRKKKVLDAIDAAEKQENTAIDAELNEAHGVA